MRIYYTIRAVVGHQRTQAHIRSGLREIGLYPLPITDDIVSEIVDALIDWREAFPKWGPVSHDFGKAISADPQSRQFDAREYVDEIVKHINWRARDGSKKLWSHADKVADRILKKHGLAADSEQQK